MRVGFLLAGGQALGMVARIVVVECDVGMGLRPRKGLDGTRLQVGGIGGELREAAIDLRPIGIGACRAIGCRGRGWTIIARPLGGRRRAGVRQAHHRQHRAVVVLHAHQPVQPPLHLVEQVGHAVAGFGNIEVVGPDLRLFGIGAEQRDDIGRGPVRVLVVIAGIEPAAVQVALGRFVVGLAVKARFAILALAHVVEPVGPAVAGISGVLHSVGALIVQHAHGGPEHGLVDLRADGEGIGVVVCLLVADQVAAGRGHRRKVEAPGVVARSGIDGAVSEHDRLAFIDHGAGLDVDDLVDGARREIPAGVEAGFGVADDGDLLHGGQVAELVDHDKRRRRRVVGGLGRCCKSQGQRQGRLYQAPSRCHVSLPFFV